MSRDTPFVDFPAGSPVLREHEAAGALFVIEAGKVAIQRGATTVAELGPGDVFGEAALLQDHGHATNAVARTAVRALKLEVATLPAVLRENVDVAMQLMRRLVQRLHAAEAMAVDAPSGARASESHASTARPAPSAADAGSRAAAHAANASAPHRVALAPAADGAANAPSPHVAASAPAAHAAASAPAADGAANASAPCAPAPLAAEITEPLPPMAREPRNDPIDIRPRTETVAPAPSGAPAPTAQSVPNGPPVITHVLRHATGVIALPGDKAECLVGRPDPATGAIPEINLGPLDLARSLSRRHARMFITGTTVSLREEPGVSNGTWVNGERLAAGQQVILKPGDKLRFGAIELEFGTA